MSTRDLLQEIQAEAVDGNSDLSTLLRKCVVLSFQLNNPDLKKWAQSELDGYALSTDLPDYRVIKGVPSFGSFLGIAGSALRNAPLSLLGLPEPVRERFANPEVREGVRSIAELITANQKEGLLRWPWPPEACEIFNHEGYRADFRLAEAWISVPVSRFVGILDTVRNRS
jgi:hypothetical protein